MRSARLALVFSAAVFATVTAEAQPRPQFTPQPTPLAVILLPAIDDPIVIADLKLKDEQVKALVARRTELWDEAYTTAPKTLSEGAAARTETTNALLKKTLTAGQYKRATQLGAQGVLRVPAFGKSDPDTPEFQLTRATTTILQRYPELAAAFKLTDEQKNQLDLPAPKGLGARGITMSKEQADAMKEFLGPTAKSWQIKSDPRFAARPYAPDGFYLLEAKDVRADVKLTDADAKAMAALAEKWQKLDSDRLSELSPKDADAQAAVLKAESEKAMAALKPEQLTRLKQIAFQTNAFDTRGGPGGFGRGAIRGTHIDQLYADRVVVKELTITEQQAKEFVALREAFEKDAIAVLASADALAPAEKTLNELAAARRKKAEEILTADQAAKLKALVGEPFTGYTAPDRLVWQLGPNSQPVEAMRAAMFGKHSNELNLLALNKSIQEELKLTDEQIRTAAEKYRDVLAVRLPTPFESDAYAKTMAERSKVTAEALAKILNEDQAKRFRQIMLQSRERRPDGGFISPVTINSAAVYPGVAEAVKLDDEQKKKLIAGKDPAEVLTPGQKDAIQKMLGEPFKGDFVIRKTGVRSPFSPVPAVVQLFMSNEKAATESLKLTDDQLKVLTAARQAYSKAAQDALPFGFGGNPNDALAARRAAAEAFDKSVADALTAEQKRRLAQLALQVDAAQNLVAALTAPETAKRLALTDDQRAKLIALGEEATRLQGLRAMHVRFDPDLKLGLQMRDAADYRVMGALSETQKKAWKEMIGEPLPGLTKTVPGRFGGPGFGP